MESRNGRELVDETGGCESDPRAAAASPFLPGNRFLRPSASSHLPCSLGQLTSKAGRKLKRPGPHFELASTTSPPASFTARPCRQTCRQPCQRLHRISGDIAPSVSLRRTAASINLFTSRVLLPAINVCTFPADFVPLVAVQAALRTTTPVCLARSETHEGADEPRPNKNSFESAIRKWWRHLFWPLHSWARDGRIPPAAP